MNVIVETLIGTYHAISVFLPYQLKSLKISIDIFLKCCLVRSNKLAKVFLSKQT